MSTLQARALADAVVAESLRLVALAGAGDWGAIPAGLARRRACLAVLERAVTDVSRDAATLAAVRAAVLESERAIAWVLPAGPGRHH